jgi:protein-tyrosine phosphatase
MKSPIYWINGPWPGRLAIVPRPRGGEWLADELGSLQAAGIDLLVSALTNDENRDFELAQEGELAHASGLEFFVFPIPDRGLPPSLEKMETFVRKLDDRLSKGKNVAVHCRQGIGRSSLLAACTLIVGGVGPAQALERIEEARGCSVPDTPAQRAWVSQFASKIGLVKASD